MDADPEVLLVDIPTAAKMLSTSQHAVRYLLIEKKLPKLRLGRKIMIDPADLRALIKKEKQ